MGRLSGGRGPGLLAGGAAALLIAAAAGALLFRSPPARSEATVRREAPAAAPIAAARTAPATPRAVKPPPASARAEPGPAAPTRFVSGRVFDPEGRPVRGARVAARPAGVPGEERRWEQWCVVATSDANGAYRLDDVHAGPAEIGADAPPLALVSAIVVVPPDGALEGVDIALAGGGAVSGNVLDVEGNAIAGATVAADGFWSIRDRIATTGGDGGYRLRGLPAGVEIALHARAEGRPAIDAPPVVLPLTGEKTGVNFILDAIGVIAGHVLDEDGTPIAGASVHFVREHEEHFSFPSSSFQPTEITCDANGAFRLEALPRGTYDLLAVVPKRGFVRRTVDLGAGRVEDADLVLGPRGKVRIFVRDDEGNMVQSAACVRVTGRDGRSIEVGGAPSTFLLPPDTYEISADAFDLGEGRVADVVIAADATAPDVTVVLATPALISGSVRLPPGERMEDWRDAALVVGESGNAVFIEPDGTFTFTTGKRGALRLQAFCGREGKTLVGETVVAVERGGPYPGVVIDMRPGSGGEKELKVPGVRVMRWAEPLDDLPASRTDR